MGGREGGGLVAFRGRVAISATDEACVYLKHPLFEGDQRRMLPEVLKSSFCGRFSGRWDDASSDAGAVWSVLQNALREGEQPPAPAS